MRVTNSTCIKTHLYHRNAYLAGFFLLYLFCFLLFFSSDQSALEAEKDATDDIDEDEDMDLGVKVDVARKQKAQQLFPLSVFFNAHMPNVGLITRQ